MGILFFAKFANGNETGGTPLLACEMRTADDMISVFFRMTTAGATILTVWIKSVNVVVSREEVMNQFGEVDALVHATPNGQAVGFPVDKAHDGGVPMVAFLDILK